MRSLILYYSSLFFAKQLYGLGENILCNSKLNIEMHWKHIRYNNFSYTKAISLTDLFWGSLMVCVCHLPLLCWIKLSKWHEKYISPVSKLLLSVVNLSMYTVNRKLILSIFLSKPFVFSDLGSCWGSLRAWKRWLYSLKTISTASC